MPTPNKNETKIEFMERCLHSDEAQEDTDDSDELYGQCIGTWQNRNNE